MRCLRRSGEAAENFHRKINSACSNSTRKRSRRNDEVIETDQDPTGARAGLGRTNAVEPVERILDAERERLVAQAGRESVAEPTVCLREEGER